MQPEPHAQVLGGEPAALGDLGQDPADAAGRSDAGCSRCCLGPRCLGEKEADNAVTGMPADDSARLDDGPICFTDDPPAQGEVAGRRKMAGQPPRRLEVREQQRGRAPLCPGDLIHALEVARVTDAGDSRQGRHAGGGVQALEGNRHGLCLKRHETVNDVAQPGIHQLPKLLKSPRGVGKGQPTEGLQRLPVDGQRPLASAPPYAGAHGLGPVEVSTDRVGSQLHPAAVHEARVVGHVRAAPACVEDLGPSTNGSQHGSQERVARPAPVQRRGRARGRPPARVASPAGRARGQSPSRACSTGGRRTPR